MFNVQNTLGNSTQQQADFIIKNTNKAGIVMIIIGLFGILVPNLIALSFNALVGGVFFLAAIALAYNAWQTKSADRSLWFKPFILAVLATIILLHPAIVLSVLGLLIAIYFIFSGFSSIVLSVGLKSSAKGWLLFNGMLSFVMGILVFDSWPFGSAWLIGLLIGLSFLFDGIALLSIAKQMNKSS